MSLILNIEKRDLKNKFPEANKVESLTQSIKGVFYSKKEESTSITIPYADFKKVWREAGGSSLITLKGIGEEKEAIIQAIDFDPFTDDPRHVDFYIVERGKVMEAEIPLEFVGVAPAMKELGGLLVKALHELKIEVMPKDLPKMIEVDISSLVDFESQILAKDLKLPESAKIIGDENEVVAIITEAKEVEEELSSEPESIADVEIEKKGKTEEEGTGETSPKE
ncbi:MAG: 50S ribosomal protein L25 [Candidatus Pacebacteria bacterium]|nr:50S ribosomal protein L25 [Candidatus Paceibacterota bacterium]